MDPAQEIENYLLALQKPMNEILDHGSSAIQQYYKGATVFITGGSGFLGKQLVEKLFRSCEIKKMYMLLRSRKGQTVEERLASMLNNTLYDTLRQKQPQFADRIVPLEGDITEIQLGISDKVWDMLTNEVNVIFHMAATVRFNEPIKVATLINIRGTREVLSLGKQCKNLLCFNHTSTAFAHATVSRIDSDVEEKFYPCPIPPNVMIEMVETMDEDRLNSITPHLIEGWPNTYTFTKAIAEELIRTTAGDLTVCIVKPPVVMSAYTEPAPGWIDFKTCLGSPIGSLLGTGLGILHVVLVDKDNIISYAPVDYVNNATIAASWDSTNRRKDGDQEIPVYTISTSGRKTKWKFFGDALRSEEFAKLATPKAVWYCCCYETPNAFLYWLLTWFFHYIPGYLVDFLADVLKVRPKGIPRLINVYSKVYKMTKIYEYFTFNYWNFKDENCKAMIERMSPEDRIIYNCDVRTIDFKYLLKAWCVGTRKYIVKDGLQGSKSGSQKQQYFKYANIIFLAAYGYVIYILFCLIYNVSTFVFKTIFN